MPDLAQLNAEAQHQAKQRYGNWWSVYQDVCFNDIDRLSADDPIFIVKFVPVASNLPERSGPIACPVTVCPDTTRAARRRWFGRLPAAFTDLCVWYRWRNTSLGAKHTSPVSSARICTSSYEVVCD